jgi:hypothetical protein
MSMKAQVLLCVAILIVFGCLGMEEIDRQAWYPRSLLSGSIQLLLGGGGGFSDGVSRRHGRLRQGCLA